MEDKSANGVRRGGVEFVEVDDGLSGVVVVLGGSEEGLAVFREGLVDRLREVAMIYLHPVPNT